MLYIAEVKKQKYLFMGGTKTVLHLLACQQNDNRWSAIPGEEVISTEDVTQQFAEGALVTVNLGPNRQVQGSLNLAGPRVANLLQTFSRQVEKTKGQEEEIEEWKQSLTIQAQELNRRQNELQEAEARIEDKEEELSALEKEREEIQQLREQWERDRAELEGAWEQLRGEQQRLQVQQEELQGKQGLTPEQGEALRNLVQQVESAIAATQTTLDPLNTAETLVKEQTETIQGQWKTLDQQRQQAEQKQKDAEQINENLKTLRQQLQEKEGELLQRQQRLATAQSQVDTKQQIVTYLAAQLQKQSEARDILSRLVINSPQLKIQQEIDTQSLEKMPVEQLEEEFNSMQKSFEQAVSFVKDQEEELDYQLQSVRELEEQLKQAQSSEKENIRNELAEEEDRYRFLEKTLVGQRRNLMSREDIMEQYKRVLKRRQGETDWTPDVEKVDLSPIFNKIDDQRDYSEDEYHQVNEELKTLQTQVEELETTVKEQQQECDKTRTEIDTLVANWQDTQKEANELLTRVEVNGETLHHQEEKLQEIREKLDAIAQAMEKINISEQQKQLSQVQELLNSL
ncbi:hypothetical protein PCC7418_0224 [Halothece sp. PCC 7418]|uniref:pilus motility taxis protein HmpF n=1 Tax=Halothece sp. (strain PCC 7418) TaxID=65093 RepID=UPI0002A06088|nr:pilus motility taxis protein HmpF [Halothece sp. PCC 7418]AFZ42461.1 hypothetical protein PCC7418_0224 [Halothece sp. PCC 7418]